MEHDTGTFYIKPIVIKQYKLSFLCSWQIPVMINDFQNYKCSHVEVKLVGVVYKTKKNMLVNIAFAFRPSATYL